MTSKPLTKEEARRSLVEHALREIYDASDFSKFHDKVFCVLMKYGLLMRAKEEDLFSGDEWTNPSNREILVKRVEQFLIKHII